MIFYIKFNILTAKKIIKQSPEFVILEDFRFLKIEVYDPAPAGDLVFQKILLPILVPIRYAIGINSTLHDLSWSLI